MGSSTHPVSSKAPVRFSLCREPLATPFWYAFYDIKVFEWILQGHAGWVTRILCNRPCSSAQRTHGSGTHTSSVNILWSVDRRTMVWVCTKSDYYTLYIFIIWKVCRRRRLQQQQKQGQRLTRSETNINSVRPNTTVFSLWSCRRWSLVHDICLVYKI